MDDLDKLVAADAAWKRAQADVDLRYAERIEAARHAYARGFKPGAIAGALKLSLGRVSQILGPKKQRRRGRTGGATVE